MAVETLQYHETPSPEYRGAVVSVGNFDGVHAGHRALIDAARELAGPEGRVIPVTFDPHPLQLLSPAKYQPPLTTLAERARLLCEIGADRVVALHTGAELLALSPEYFFETIISQALDARGLVEGFNFRFGKDRTGDNVLLRQLCLRLLLRCLHLTWTKELIFRCEFLLYKWTMDCQSKHSFLTKTIGG